MNQNQTKYNFCKKVVEIIESGNIHDPRYKLIIESLTVEHLEEIQKIVKAQEYDNEIKQKIYEALN